MTQSRKAASSEQTTEDNRIGPFVVEPKYDCPHLGDRAYVLVQSTELADGQQPPCTDCGKTQENWACLHENCQHIGCSRYHQKHMLSHHESTGHNICLSLSDHSVFCYACDSYIDSPQLHGLNLQLSRTSR